MLESKAEAKVTQLLSTAGIHINGDQPWDIQVHDKRLYRRILKEPSLGIGEGYMENWWDCEKIDVFFYRLLRDLHHQDIYKIWTFLRFVFINAISNQQSSKKSHDVADQHYNLGNDLFEVMLGDSMAYTCAYWKDAETLDKAQFDKYDLVCKKLELKPGEELLELGCGFGGFAKFAAENYGVNVTAINISEKQVDFAKSFCADYSVKIIQSDYRDVGAYNSSGKKFDKIASIGLCEHVGPKNYTSFVQLAREQLKEDGLFLLHTIGKNKSTIYADPWVQRYIFPHGSIPGLVQLVKALEGVFVVEDLQNFGAYYDRTLMRWCENFESGWSELKVHYDERFYRMWRYYLLSCAGAFRARDMQLWQFVLSPRGKLNGYEGIR